MIVGRLSRVKDARQVPWRGLRVRAVAPVAAVCADQLAVQPEHLRAAKLALLTLCPSNTGLRVLRRLLLVTLSHGPQYTDSREGRLLGTFYGREFRKLLESPATGLDMADFIPAEVRIFCA